MSVITSKWKKTVNDANPVCTTTTSTNNTIEIGNNTNTGFLYNLFIELTNSHSLAVLNAGRVLNVGGYNLVDLENELLTIGGQGSSVNTTQ